MLNIPWTGADSSENRKKCKYYKYVTKIEYVDRQCIEIKYQQDQEIYHRYNMNILQQMSMKDHTSGKTIRI